jgi:hypothetical protein
VIAYSSEICENPENFEMEARVKLVDGVEHLSVKETADLLGVSETVVRGLYDSGALKGFRTRPLVGNRWITADSARAYRAAQQGGA